MFSCVELCTQVKETYADIYMSTEAVHSAVSLLHTTLFTRQHTKQLRQYRVGCVMANVNKQVMPEICRHLTASHAYSNPYLVSLLFVPSLHSTFFLIQTIF